MSKRILILGAGGRDFHIFNVLFRDNIEYEVVAFTASQIPGIANRIYPPSLAGKLYPKGIPIYDEQRLGEIIKEHKIDEVILAYSDLLYEDVMKKASIVLANGADFRLISPFSTMLKIDRPVIAVTASRTGAGKSTITRALIKILKKFKVRFVVIRHPMAYGDLEKNVVVRLGDINDLEEYGLTIEEKEEFEPLLREGVICYEGVDYAKVFEMASREADVIIWDGGNNDLPFVKPNLMITAVDPLRLGHENSYPGEINVRLADVIVITKANTAPKDNVEKTKLNVRNLNSKALILEADFDIEVDNPSLIKDREVLVVEDGPTVTHGHMPYGAGYVAAIKYGAKKIIDPRPYAKGVYKEIYEKYSHMEKVIPTIGYNEEQLRALEDMINSIKADSIVLGTMSDISRYLKLNKPVARVSYYLKEKEHKLESIIENFLNNILKK
jgi:predicted GTPase